MLLGEFTVSDFGGSWVVNISQKFRQVQEGVRMGRSNSTSLSKKRKKIKGPNVCEEREGAGLVRESRAAAIDRALGTS